MPYTAIITCDSETYEEKDFDIGQTVGEFIERFAQAHDLDESNLYVICQNKKLIDESSFDELELTGDIISITVAVYNLAA